MPSKVGRAGGELPARATDSVGLKARLSAAAETKTLGLGDVGSVVTGVVKVSLLLEAITALVLALRFATTYDETWPRALWLGVFHAVSAFNNAGFALYSDSLIGFVTDPWICLPIALASWPAGEHCGLADS
ncbi:potassium transporter TrkG [Streptomyces rubiginosohelvolus]|uniref:potassium transporter TrkG n=1 Tax=Streptomyces rubiginosohelvolus TaxID=67362 RepID=UPI0035DF224D